MSANPSEQKRGPFSSLINDWESGLGLLKQRAVLGVESVRTRLAPIKQKGVRMARATKEWSLLTKVELGITAIGVVTAITELIHAFPYAVGLEDPKEYHPLVIPAVLEMFENMFPPVSSVEDDQVPVPTLVPVTPEGTPFFAGALPSGTAVVEATGELITITPAAATSTLRPPTEIVKSPTAEATERIRPTEKPLAGQLFDLDCTEVSWDECQQQISSLLMPLLEKPWQGTQSIIWDRENKSVVFSPVPRASFKLQWTGLDGNERKKTGLVFDIKQDGRRIIQPVLSADPLGEGEDIIGLLWYVGTVDKNGVPMSLDSTFSTDLMNRLFVKQEKVHVINIVTKPVPGRKWNDTEAIRIASKIGVNESGIAPIRLVFGIGMEN